MISHSTKHWLALAAFLAVAIVLTLILRVKPNPQPTIFPPPEFPTANLRVDVHAIKDGIPVPGFRISWSAFNCPTSGGVKGGKVPRSPRWRRSDWCDPVKPPEALNLPVETDANGEATLWFSVQPPPHLAEVGTKTELYDSAPGVSVNEGIYYDDTLPIPLPRNKMKVITADHWEIFVTRWR